QNAQKTSNKSYYRISHQNQFRYFYVLAFMMKKTLLFLTLTAVLWQSCSTTQKIKTGDQAFEQKSFSIATSLYKSEFNTEPVPQYKAIKAFRIAESYRMLNDRSEERR